MANFILSLQAKESKQRESEPMASHWSTVLCGHSWASITC